MPGRAPGRPSLRPCARPRQRSFRPSFPLPFPCLRWLEGTPLPSAFGSRPGVGPGRSFGFQETHLKNAFLALLDELANFLSSLASNLFVERGAVLVAHGFAALSPPELATLLADLLVERSATLRLDRLAAFLADLLVEARAAFRLDRVAALLADLLVESAAALRLYRLAALAADLLVEGVPVFVAHRLAALAACLRHAHRALLLARILFSHSRPPHTPLSGANWFRPRRDVPRREPRSALRPAAIRSRTRCPPSLPISW